MLKELDRIVLTAPLASEGLERGDVGTIVATVEAAHVRPVGPREIVHARQLAAR
jgi:hypothetical protein